MLPDGFEWRQHMDTPALCLDGRMVATYSRHPGAPYVLAYFHSSTARYTGKTYGSEATARAYIEGWARRWHAQLRAEYAGLGQPFVHLARSAQSPSVSV